MKLSYSFLGALVAIGLVAGGCGGGSSTSSSGNNEDAGVDSGVSVDATADVGVDVSTEAAAACPGTQMLCGAVCSTLSSDPANCGACGKACATGEFCVSGSCKNQCATGQTGCSGDAGTYCANTGTDDDNCGSCGNTCVAGQVCSGGKCGTTCATGEALCAGDAGSPYCASEQTDNANCGSCGNTCPAGQVCGAGLCGATCGTGETLCAPDGGAPYCAGTQTDNANCGTCGNACPSGQVCSAGTCGLTCLSPQSLCTPDGGAPYCASEQTDNANCGSCGNVCAAGQICTASVCVSTCPGSTPTFCGTGATAYCANTTDDPGNCGACGTACPTGGTCAASHCACPTGQTSCGTGAGACVPTGQCLTGALPTDCAQLRLLAPTLVSGAYTIDPDGAGPIGPFAVFCDMAADGGGWTLTLKADGTANNVNAARFDFNSSVWTTTTTTDPNYAFNTASPDITTRVSAKYMSFNTLPYTQVRLGMATAAGVGSINYVQFSLPGNVAYTAGAGGKVAQTSLQATFSTYKPGGTMGLPGTGSIMIGQAGIPGENSIGQTVTQQFVPPAGAGSPTRAEWLNLTQPSYLQPYCNFGGMNVDTTGGNATWARSRVGFLGNEAGDCTSPDSYMGLGNNGVTCGEPSYTVGNSAGCVPSGIDGAVGGFAYLYVRNTDFRTVVPAQASCEAHFTAGYRISGIYPITYGATSIATYCDMVHAGGGWTLAYKFSSGLPTTDDANLLWNGAAQNESVPAQLNVASAPSAPMGPYLSRIVQSDWNVVGGFTVKKTRVVLYNGEEEGQSLTFTIPVASSTNIDAWFAPGNLATSTWTDVTTAGTYNFFSIAGDTLRKFSINKSYGGCPADTGWMFITDGATEGCAYETQWSTLPPVATNTVAAALILYANQPIAVGWQTLTDNVALATAMAVYVQ